MATSGTAKLDLRGLDKDGIKPINSKISEFQSQLDAYITSATNITGNSIFKNAIKGANVEAAIKAYQINIANEMKKLVSKLNKFQTELNKLEGTYDTQSETKAKAIFNIK